MTKERSAWRARRIAYDESHGNIVFSTNLWSQALAFGLEEAMFATSSLLILYANQPQVDCWGTINLIDDPRPESSTVWVGAEA